MKIIRVGGGTPFPNLNIALKENAGDNIRFELEPGDYSNVKIKDRQGIEILGIGAVCFTGYFLIYDAGVALKNVVFTHSNKHGAMLVEGSKLLATQCVFLDCSIAMRLTNTNYSLADCLYGNCHIALWLKGGQGHISSLTIGQCKFGIRNELSEMDATTSIWGGAINKPTEATKFQFPNLTSFAKQPSEFEKIRNAFINELPIFHNPKANDFRLKNNFMQAPLGASHKTLLMAYDGEHFPGEAPVLKPAIHDIIAPEQAIPDLPLIQKVFVFSNSSKDRFEKMLFEACEKAAVTVCARLEDKPELCIFVQAFDAPASGPMQKHIEQAVKENIPFYIFMAGEDYSLSAGEMNLDGYKQVQSLRSSLQREYAAQLVEVKDSGEFNMKLMSKLKSAIVKRVRIEKVRLKHIGLFEQLEIKLDKRITVIVGVNGTGKTTLLRALALALVEPQHKALDMKAVQSLLCIKDRHQATTILGEGEIEVQYTQGQTQEHHTVWLVPDEETETIQLHGEIPNGLFDARSLKSLVIGFGQHRDFKGGDKDAHLPVTFMPAKSGDLTPLINNEEGGNLHQFISWIANLKNESVKEPAKAKLIDLAFEIFSHVAGEAGAIAFLELAQVSPLEVWIKTKETPKGIPYQLASQGCQSVMGWLGYLLKRLYEAYPNSADCHKEPFVALIDEIDAYLHPRWQQNILPTLLTYFPKGQFIVTTHSPLVVEGLERGQFIRLEHGEEGITCTTNTLNTWAWNYEDLLTRLFRTDSRSEIWLQRFHEKKAELEQTVSSLTQKEDLDEKENAQLDEAKQTLQLLELSETAWEEFEEMKQRLERKETLLDTLIQKRQRE